MLNKQLLSKIGLVDSILAEIQRRRQYSYTIKADISRVIEAEITNNWTKVYSSHLYNLHGGEFCELLSIINEQLPLKRTYRLSYTLYSEKGSINHFIDINGYWLSFGELKNVYQIAFKENLKQMQKINKEYIQEGLKPMYCNLTLTETTTWDIRGHIIGCRTDILEHENLIATISKEMKQVV